MRFCFKFCSRLYTMNSAIPSKRSITHSSTYGKIISYTPPSWMNKIRNIPPITMHLAMTPTPIHDWDLPGVPQNFQVHIKRDDLTGSNLSGNKVRKLEFIFGHILQNDYKNVITCGGIQSNHCRATAVMAAQLGIKSHLLLRSDSNEIGSSNGNLFLSRMCDASIYLVPKRAKYETELKPRQETLAEEISEKTGEKTYVMPVGGSNSLGLFGYLSAWQELVEQGVREKFDDVVVVCGSGGTIAGLAIGNYLTGQKVKVHAVAVCDDAKYFHGHINEMIDAIGVPGIKSEDIVDIIEGYKGAGYGISTEEDHNLYRTIASKTGIFCDPVYTGKGVKGLISELNSNSNRFKGQQILFVHTGGIYGLYDGRMFDMFTNEKVHDWHDIGKSPAQFF